MENVDWDYEKEYKKLAKKYDLPDLGKLQENFDVEKLSDKETKFLAREVRRAMSEKISSASNFFETLVNPTSTPMFILAAIRKLNQEERETIKEIYHKLSRMHINISKLETLYSEEAEAAFIKEVFSLWNHLKKDIYAILESFDKNYDEDIGAMERNYFG